MKLLGYANLHIEIVQEPTEDKQGFHFTLYTKNTQEK
jgi:hypothetical protein